MQQDIDLLVQVVIKCLNDTVIPSLENNDPVAHQQALLCLQTLRGVKGLIPLRHHFARESLRSTINTAMDLSQNIQAVDGVKSFLLDREISKFLNIHEISAVSAEEIQGADRSLNETICDLVNNLDLDGHSIKSLLASIEESIGIHRAWCFDSGLESEDILDEFVNGYFGEVSDER